MRCRKAQRLVSVNLDGQLDDAQRTALREHLAGCLACGRFADQVRGISDALSAMQVPEPRPHFTQRLLARLPDQQVERFSLREWSAALRPAPLAAGGLALAAGVIMAVVMNGQQRVPAPTTVDPAREVCAESFDPLPDGSAAARYVALVNAGGR
jgi:anti-sigma factor RsiW